MIRIRLSLALVLSLAVANLAGAQTITSPSGVVSVTSADDYATRVLQDPWDMNQRTDLGWFTFGADQPPNNLSNISVANGLFSARPSADDSSFWLLDPEQPGNVQHGRDGKTAPIDGTTYKYLLIKMSLENSAGGQQFGQVWWSNNTIYQNQPGGGFRGSSGFITRQGWWIYALDLSALDTVGSTVVGDPTPHPKWPGPGTGMVDALRIDPTETTGSGQVQVDWVRLVDNRNADLTKTISWLGGGTYDIHLSTTEFCTDAATQVQLASGVPSGYPLLVGGLPPGDYYVALKTNGTLNSCSTGLFRVGSVPTVSFAKPGPEGSEDDFATEVLGNPWNPLVTGGTTSDIDFFRNITGLSNRSITAETEAGASLGTIDVLSGTSTPATLGTDNVGDPHVYPLWYQPGAEGALAGRGLTKRIDTTRYRILTFEMSVPRSRDLLTGSIARVIWKIAGEPKENETEDIILNHLDPAANSGKAVMQTITLDLADRTKVPLTTTRPDALSTSGWVNGSDPSPGLDIFRIDPHEFANPTDFYLRRAKLAALEQADTSFELSVAVTDPAGATVSFFADGDGTGFDVATAISGCESLPAAPTTLCNWNTTGITHGDLRYPYAVVKVNGTVVNQAYARWPVKIHHPGDVRPTLTVDRASLLFNSVVGTATTPAQSVTVGQVGSGTMPWTVSSSVPWLQVSPTSGTGARAVTVQLTPGHSAPQTVGTVYGVVTFVAQNSNTRTINVTLSVVPTGASSPPFGQVDSPVNNATGVQGAIGVTGWALDDMGVSKVEIFRNCLPVDGGACQLVNGFSAVYVGDAAFVPGARDLSEFSNYPQNYRGGWGYLMLTNMLPNVTRGLAYGGQGALTIYAFATDVDGHRRLLGREWSGPLANTPTSITMANETIAKPFGAIDTPGQGQTVSGLLPNFGWALTPDSNTVADPSDIVIPTNGSTMRVYVDGADLGPVVYNQCRFGNNPVSPGTFCEDDVANIFGNLIPKSTGDSRTSNPTLFRNLDAGKAAIGAYDINTTLLTNGSHSIAWGVTDSAGRGEGIGSRNFIVLNGSSLMANRVASAIGAIAADAAVVAAIGRTADLEDRSISVTEVRGRTGFDFTRGTELVAPSVDGVRHVRMPELGRLELWLGEGVTAGYIKANADLRPLPPGSQLDTDTGRFTWGPLVGYIGSYDLVFVNGDGQIPVSVTLEPKSSEMTAGLMRGYIDQPADRATVAGTFAIGGWALDLGAWQGSGVGAVHVWARNVSTAGLSVFLGAAEVGVARPDVAASFGVQGERSGWQVPATLPPGTYEVTAYFWSTRTGRFEDARTIGVTVR